MSIFTKMFQATEELATKAIIKSKLNKFINNVDNSVQSNNDAFDSFQNKVEDSTGNIAEIIDAVSGVWVRGSKTGASLLVQGMRNNEDAVVNLVANNKDTILTLLSCIKKLDTDINKQSVRSIVKNVKEELTDYYNGDFVDDMDHIGETIIQPLSESIGNTWGKTKRYSILVDGELTGCTEEHFEEHRKGLSNFCMTNSMWHKYQITPEEMEVVKANPRSRKVNL